MSGQLKPDEKLADGLRRIARRQARVIRRCQKHLGGRDPVETVHQARKGIKKLRALLRLIRGRLEGPVYQRQKQRLRLMARSLAPVRDTAVQLQTLQKLRPALRRQITEEAWAALRTMISRKKQKQLAALARSKKARDSQCRSVLGGIGEWKLKGLGWRDFRPGLNASLHRFARGYQQARRTPTAAALHEWRKRAKDLAHQWQLLKRRRPRSAKKFGSHLNELAETLGDDHDLALLEQLAAKGNPATARGVRNVTRARRRELQESAFKLGEKWKKTPGLGKRLDFNLDN